MRHRASRSCILLLLAWAATAPLGAMVRGEAGPCLREALHAPESHPEAAVLEPEEEPGDPALSVQRAAGTAPPASPRALQSSSIDHPPLSFDILLLTQRQNE